MIKFAIKTRSKFINNKATIKFRKKLRSMLCKNCKIDTIIKFLESDKTLV